ncbi:MAG: DUF488 domain-containing protein [Deltaproteobacteria bacterium]|nr:DUF488 domain-containing protein [Deltaproteobacteria bacterium]
MIKIKRIYDEPSDDDGYRALVDRLWPRGVSKEKAQIDTWLKDAGPSDELRKWFNHDPEKWFDFKERYFAELEQQRDTLEPLIENMAKGITLLYSAKDQQYNNAVALKEFLEKLTEAKGETDSLPCR